MFSAIRRNYPHISAVLMLGIVSQVVQVLLIRELLMVFHGNELAIGLILASWLFWVGLGSQLGAVYIERAGRLQTLLTVSTGSLLLILPSTIFLVRIWRGFFNLPPGAFLSLIEISLSCFLLMAPACFLLGIQFVLLSRIWHDFEGIAGPDAIAKTYVNEAIGNMLGGLIFTLLLVHYLNSFQSSVLVGILMFCTSLIIIRKNLAYDRPLLRWFPLFLLLTFAVVLTIPFLESINSWTNRVQWRLFSPKYELIETYQSKHGNIAVLKLEEQYSFFQSGHLVFSSAGPKAVSPGLEEQEAVKFAHMAMVQHNNPENILLIGGGLRGVLVEIARHPVKTIDYIELDEVLTVAARPYITESTLSVLKDPRVNLIHTDGRLFIKTAQEKYDMIIIDIPDPATAVLNRYYTRDFFSEAKKLLKSEGVLVTAAVSTPGMRGIAIANRNATIYHTLKSVFSEVLPAGENILYYFASDCPEQISLDLPLLQQRYRQRNIETESFSEHHYTTLLQENPLRRTNWILRNHGRNVNAHLIGPLASPLLLPSIPEQELVEEKLPPVNEQFFINTDFKPIGYFYSLLFWDDLTRPEHMKTFNWLLLIKPWWFLPLIIIPLLSVFLIKKYRKRGADNAAAGFAVIYAVSTTGFSTMALQIALIFSFQSIYGFVYETVGLIIAIFMFGLALGAYITNRYIKNKNEIRTLAVVQLIIALLAVIIAFSLLRTAQLQSPILIFIIFSALTFTAGLINGIDFPLSTACYQSMGKSIERTAGNIYGVELFGACAGAVLASVFLAPVLGILACCYFAAVANGTAFIVLLISGRLKI